MNFSLDVECHPDFGLHLGINLLFLERLNLTTKFAPSLPKVVLDNVLKEAFFLFEIRNIKALSQAPLSFLAPSCAKLNGQVLVHLILKESQIMILIFYKVTLFQVLNFLDQANFDANENVFDGS